MIECSQCGSNINEFNKSVKCTKCSFPICNKCSLSPAYIGNKFKGKYCDECNTEICRDYDTL